MLCALPSGALSGINVRECISQMTSRPAHAERRNQLKYKFRMTVEEYDALLESQGGVCAICGAEPGVSRLAVDHDRKCCPQRKPTCGKCVRGLLCIKCNVHLSWIEDEDWRRKADAYLERDFNV